MPGRISLLVSLLATTAASAAEETCRTSTVGKDGIVTRAETCTSFVASRDLGAGFLGASAGLRGKRILFMTSHLNPTPAERRRGTKDEGSVGVSLLDSAHHSTKIIDWDSGDRVDAVEDVLTSADGNLVAVLYDFPGHELHAMRNPAARRAVIFDVRDRLAALR